MADLIFTQAALHTVRDAVRSRRDTSLFGLLLGEVRQDPTCNRPWVRVNRVLCGPAISGDPSATSLSEIMSGMLTGLSEERPVVGWYRSHPGAGLYLSLEEARFHETRFADPWGFSLVFVADAGRLTGAVFQRTEPEGLSRSVYTPFYELVDDSSEFNGTTKRTYVGWPNYQTETRVVQAGEGNVSAGIPDGARAVLQVVTPPPTAEEPAERPRRPEPDPAPAAKPPQSPAPATPARKSVGTTPAKGSRRPESESGKDLDVEWEKKQIQRTLTAVNRSIDPSALGELDVQVPVDAEPPASPADDTSDGDAGREEPADGLDPDSSEPVVRAQRRVIPISSHRPSPAEEGLVGRSRRRSTLPVAKILSAAATLSLLAGAGWFGARLLGGASPDSAPDGASGGSSMAGLSLAPTDLFVEQAVRQEPDPVGVNAADTGLHDTDAGFAAPADPLDSADESEIQEGAVATDEGPAEAGAVAVENPATSRFDPVPRPAEPQVVDPPALDRLALDDPEVSAFRNALQIFEAEVARYDETRVEFDRGDAACDPLNLAARGVRESFARLEARLRSAAQGFVGAELRSFEGARRQQAMIATHYGLTDCPPLP